MKLWSVLICEDTPIFLLEKIVVCIDYLINVSRETFNIKTKRIVIVIKAKLHQKLINVSRETCSNEK